MPKPPITMSFFSLHRERSIFYQIVFYQCPHFFVKSSSTLSALVMCETIFPICCIILILTWLLISNWKREKPYGANLSSATPDCDREYMLIRVITNKNRCMTVIIVIKIFDWCKETWLFLQFSVSIFHVIVSLCLYHCLVLILFMTYKILVSNDFRSARA